MIDKDVKQIITILYRKLHKNTLTMLNYVYISNFMQLIKLNVLISAINIPFFNTACHASCSFLYLRNLMKLHFENAGQFNFRITRSTNLYNNSKSAVNS